ARAHRLQDEIRLGGGRHREDGHRGTARSQPLDRRHPRRRVGPDVDHHQVGVAPLGIASFDDADRNAARAQQPRDLSLEFVVVADDLRRELGHGFYFTSRMEYGNAASGGAAASALRRPPIGVMRPTTSLPFISSMKKPM